MMKPSLPVLRLRSTMLLPTKKPICPSRVVETKWPKKVVSEVFGCLLFPSLRA